jgi:tRNA pseudouridine32 synthase/23S rRNA pseudouridine746 synthase
MMLHAADLTVPREGRETIHAHAPFPERFIALGFSDPDAEATDAP